MNEILSLYLQSVEGTEPPVAFHRWCYTTTVGALLGRRVWLPFGSSRIFPQLYVMLMGEPASRKSSAIKYAKKIVREAGFQNLSGDSTSKEKFLLDLEGVETEGAPVKDVNKVMQNLFGAGDDPTTASESFIIQDEFNDFCGPANMSFFSMLGSFWDWDDPVLPFQQRLKNSRSVSVYQPTISILAGQTHTGFTACFPPTASGQGFLSRLIFVYWDKPKQRITWPAAADKDLVAALTDSLRAVQDNAYGPMEMTSGARSMLDDIYQGWKPLEDTRFSHYSSRRFTHLLRICIGTAAANMRMCITEEDVLYSNTMLSFAEYRMPEALGEYGKAKNADVTGKVVEILQKAIKPVPLAALWAKVSRDLASQSELANIINGLTATGAVRWVVDRTHPDDSGYLGVRVPLNRKQRHTDFSLIGESEGF